MAEAIQATVRSMQMDQTGRLRDAVGCARLYGNAPLTGLGGMGAVGRVPTVPGEQYRDNVIQSVVDTATARIGENKPRPYFLTSGGDYPLQRKAKKLNKFAEGLFYEQKAYEVGGESQRDCEIFGDGLLHVGDEFDRLKYTRVLAVELWVDEAEAQFGTPRQLHWERPVDRMELAARYPKKRKEILAAARAKPNEYGWGPHTLADMVVVRYSWHLRSKPEWEKGEKPDGLCVKSIEGTLLCEPEQWDEDFYPFARFQWGTRPVGYWSQGLAERLRPKQLELNKLNALIQAAMHRAAKAPIFLERGSKVVKEHISNDIGPMVEYTGTEPKFGNPAPLHPDYYQRCEDIRRSMYEETGLSIQSATGEKPAGLNSGEAQRVYRDTVAERLKTHERLNEAGYMDLARVSVAVARRIAQRRGFYEVKTPTGRTLKTVKMTAEELDPTDWNLQCFPTSSLPKDPAGRLQTIQEYIQAGFMTPRQGRRALDFPDLEAVESLANAEEDLISSMLDAITDEGVYEPPEPTNNLQLCKEMVVEYIERGRLHKLEPERLQLLHDWSAQVDFMMELATAALAPPPGAAPMGLGAPAGTPQGTPAAPPVSNMIPFSPQGRPMAA